MPWVDGNYRTLADPAHRAISGKSSGGFGAMITPMLRPDLFGALATHAGDALYELCYIPEFGECVRALRDYDGDIARWWDDFRSRTRVHQEGRRDADRRLRRSRVLLGCEGRHPGAAVRPAHRGDPRRDLAALAGLGPGQDGPGARGRAAVAARRSGSTRATSDDFYLDVGAEAFRAALAEAGVADEVIRFELFDGTHSSIDYRYPLALAWLCERIAG